jgi:hypothetical protein
LTGALVDQRPPLGRPEIGNRPVKDFLRPLVAKQLQVGAIGMELQSVSADADGYRGILEKGTEARFAFPQCLLRVLAHQGIGKDFSDQTQARDNVRPPVARLLYKLKGDQPDNPHSDPQRHGNDGSETVRAAQLPLFNRMVRQPRRKER